MVTLNMEMARITLPVGMKLYVVSGIANVKMKDVPMLEDISGNLFKDGNDLRMA